MAAGEKLKEYRKKRRFSVTPEPSGEWLPRGRPAKALLFVVQKHRASHLHYDLRLEWNGALLSWAVPKGPSLDPSVKRLAVAVEDHPIEYADFEGIIPAGEYGGGTVMVWDKGTYVPETPDVGKSVEKGELKFALHGKKVKGSWVLVRTGRRYAGDRGNRSWLLIKHRDSEASTDDITTEEPRSVKSHRLLAEIALDEGGDVLKAAEGDPPEALRTLVDKNPKLVPRRRNRKAAVWSSKGVT
jgi:bifunctional non-homologous end joining protein LigD